LASLELLLVAPYAVNFIKFTATSGHSWGPSKQGGYS
jgi:hypothetical protein